MAQATTSAVTDATRRHDFVFLFDVQDGNPNGDPDAGNLPRLDPETMQGLVTDGAIKRKLRDWVDVAKGEDERFKIYVQNKGIALNDLHQRAYSSLGMKSTGSKQKREDVDAARAWMCDNFFDVRTFGAVMTTGVNAGQVRGPVQIGFARSVDPIVPLDISITRVAVTRAEDASVVAGEDGQQSSGKQTEMGRKSLVPYGLYRASGSVMPHAARSTGFSDEDLGLFWTGLQQMWDLDRSASRGMVALRGLYVFTHENPLGNAPAHVLLESVTVRLKDSARSPRSFGDYEVTVAAEPPSGVTLTRLVG